MIPLRTSPGKRQRESMRHAYGSCSEAATLVFTSTQQRDHGQALTILIRGRKPRAPCRQVMAWPQSWINVKLTLSPSDRLRSDASLHQLLLGLFLLPNLLLIFSFVFFEFSSCLCWSSFFASSTRLVRSPNTPYNRERLSRRCRR